MNFIRNTVEPVPDYQFYRVLKEFGLNVKVESNLGSIPKQGLSVLGREKPDRARSFREGVRAFAERL